jgi:hypothetical protein
VNRAGSVAQILLRISEYGALRLSFYVSLFHRHMFKIPMRYMRRMRNSTRSSERPMRRVSHGSE